MKKNVKFYVINILLILMIFCLTIYKIIEENGVETFSYIRNINIISIRYFINQLYLL